MIRNSCYLFVLVYICLKTNRIRICVTQQNKFDELEFANCTVDDFSSVRGISQKL